MNTSSLAEHPKSLGDRRALHWALPSTSAAARQLGGVPSRGYLTPLCLPCQLRDDSRCVEFAQRNGRKRSLVHG